MADESENNILGGHKFSLRAKSTDQIKRIDWISNSLGSVGDFLVSTWGGIVMGIGTLGGISMLVANAITANSMNTLIQNIGPIILLVIGGLLITVNVVMTNPSAGSQFFVSLKFISAKFNKHAKSGHIQPLRAFKFYADDEKQEVIETTYKGRTRYMAIYNVQGLVSPTTFEEDLQALAIVDKQLLTAMERDTVLTTVNSIQQTKVHRKRLPNNATPAMKAQRDLQYRITSELPHNQQLRTVMVVNAPNVDILRARVDSLEIAFNNGLVIGYMRLGGRAAKRAIKNIYG